VRVGEQTVLTTSAVRWHETVKTVCTGAKVFFYPYFYGKINIMITTQFIKDETGKKLAVILPMAEYEKMLEDVEELEDIRLYDEVKARNESSITLEEYMEKRQGNNNA